MSSLTTLNRQRGVLKAKINKLSKFVLEYASSVDQPTDQEVAAVLLKNKLTTVSETKTSLKDLISSYTQLPDDTDLKDALDISADLEDELEDTEVKVNVFLSNLKSSNNQKDILAPITNFKIPDLPLPCFYGRYEEFQNFKMQFMSIIGNNKSLSPTQRLCYLKGCLKGEAKRLESAQDTYESLWSSLEERYENKRAVIDCHIFKLLNLSKVPDTPNNLMQLIDNIKCNLRALDLLDFKSNELSDALIMHIIFQKLDPDVHKGFEMKLNKNEMPNLDRFLSFLEERSRIIQGIHFKEEKKKTSFHSKQSTRPNTAEKSLLLKSKAKNCVLCNESHSLFRCDKFRNLSTIKRAQLVQTQNLCPACLNNHLPSPCLSKHSCFTCKSKLHNSLLHMSVNTNNEEEKMPELLVSGLSPSPTPANESSFFAKENKSNKSCVILNTAVIYLKDSAGDFQPLIALLDSCSSANLLTTNAANLLGLRKQKTQIPISGLNDISLTAKSFIRTELSNKFQTKSYNLDMIVVPKIAELPSSFVDVSKLNIPENITLADNKWNQPKRIDALLGAGLFYSLLGSNKFKIDDSQLLLIETIFGHVVSGIANTSKRNYGKFSDSCFLLVESENIDKTLRSFWEVENVQAEKPFESDELIYCKEHFLRTHYRNSDGRYVVQLPFKPQLSDISLGDSKQIAIKRLNQLYNRLERDPKLKELYSEFLREYESLGHMEEISNDTNPEEGYFFPHHGVLRPSSTTTKLRVVFNGSCKTTNGKSLNDLLCKGGIIQDDLFTIMIRFRKHILAFTADIKQMFRQIEVNPSQTKFQKILWREGREKPNKIFSLKTVTYGCASSPFLATRVLQQLATDEATNFPLASRVLMEDFYMDDCLTGSSDIVEFNQLKQQLIDLLKRGQMTLHKFHSNVTEVPPESQIFPFVQDSSNTSVKTLGMLWNSSSDTFSFKVTVNFKSSYTKREVLSVIARLYDPLGLLGPVICRAKIFMQQLWLIKCDWNEIIPPQATQEWDKFLKSLVMIESIQIPRCIVIQHATTILLLGFADACEKAYGASLYLQTQSQSNPPVSHLICSKSRLAPIKTMSIPRLELSACLLLCQITQRVVTALKLPIDEVTLFSDSTIALAWIDTSPHLLKTFVNNRVAQIQELSKKWHWKHIASHLNPADALSRGQDAVSLSTNKLWWKGPKFQTEDSADFARKPDLCTDEELFLKELKPMTVLTSLINSDFFISLINLSNSYQKLIRILAFICRFIFNSRNSLKRKGPLSMEELRASRNLLIKYAQGEYFSTNISALKGGISVPLKSKLKFLNPFLDSDGLLRVGGRLTNSNLSYDRSHQIILPPSNKLTKIIFIHYHKRDLHVGPQGLLNTVRQIFWPISGRNIARQVVHDCVQCFKIRPTITNQIMGNLPPERVIQSPPFSNAGLDLCGPFWIKYRNQRKGIYNKVYVAIFICMVTKAVHFELLTDLTSDALIATLKRFFARRGKSGTIFCDNATNFVGASAELKRLLKSVNEKNDNISSFLSSEQVLWKFLPPRSPNFGGLWERGVGQFKYHLKRTVGSIKLTFEELLTITAQIESILNSRPLSPLSSELENYEVLTPGHFLIGRPINALPEPNLLNIRENLLDRWQKTQKIVQLIWKNWSNSYLSHLQQRSKWFFQKQNIAPGMMVLVKEGDLPVCKWVIGRISEVVTGKDNNVRVVVVRTPQGLYKRSISNICILPIVNSDNN